MVIERDLFGVPHDRPAPPVPVRSVRFDEEGVEIGIPFLRIPEEPRSEVAAMEIDDALVQQHEIYVRRRFQAERSTAAYMLIVRVRGTWRYRRPLEIDEVRVIDDEAWLPTAAVTAAEKFK